MFGQFCFQARKPPRILVADDDISIRQLNTQVLLPCGYEVEAAEDGVAAWEALVPTATIS